MRLIPRTIGLVGLALALGCQSSVLEPWLHRVDSPPQPARDAAEIDPEILERAQSERREYLEREVVQSRADAVSAVAEARIALDRVTKSVPWRRDRVAEARAKLEEADRQLAADHLGAAMFFAARAQRITEALRAEAQQVAKWSGRRVIRGDHVNLRSAPSEASVVVEVLGASAGYTGCC
jgi:hypothetical protein